MPMVAGLLSKAQASQVLTSSVIQTSSSACSMYTRLKATSTAPMLRVSTKDFL